MDANQIDLVRSTFAKVEPIAPEAARMFYSRLFAVAPEVKALFKNDMEEQGRKLMTTIGVVVRSLERLDEVAPIAQKLAISHVEYGVKAEHYAPVGASLLWTLEQGLGDSFTSEVEAAWAAAYATLSGVMIAAAYHKDPKD